MKRLTKEKAESYWRKGRHPTKYTSRHTFQEVADRLAAYEDTGLTPEAVAQLKQIAKIFNCDPADPAQLKALCVKLQEMAQTERDGRLVVLPCKPGDTVYFPVVGRWDSATIEHIEVYSTGVRFFWVQYDIGPETEELWDDGDFGMDDIGKTVFLTRPEAEAAVERLKGEGEHG